MSFPSFGTRLTAAILAFSIAVLLALAVPQVSTATNVSGTLTGNQNWTKAGSPYILTGNVTLGAGATLTIDPGVQVIGPGLLVEGTLTSVGTPADPITFSLSEGMRFLPGTTESTIQWATLQNAGVAISLKSSGSQPDLQNIEFRNNTLGILSESSPQSLSFSNLRFFGTSEVTLSLAGSDLDLSRILIEDSGGIDIELGAVSESFELEESNLEPPSPCAVLGQGCTVTVGKNEIPGISVPYNFDDVWWGTANQATIDSLILDATDEPGSRYASVVRTADASAPHDLYPPTSKPSIPEAVMSATSVSGVASDFPTASSGIEHVTASLKDLTTNEWWDGSDWGATEQFLPTTGTSNWTLAMPTLVPGHKYEVRSMAVDGSGLVQFGASSTHFSVDTTPPDAFGLLSPKDGAVLDKTPAFAWEEAVDFGSGLKHYEVYIDGAKVAEISSGTEAFGLPGLASGIHTWSVRAVDGAGNSRASEVRSFTVDTTPPDAFSLLNPANEAVTNANPSLSWEEAVDPGSGLKRYEVYIDGAKVAEISPGTESFEPSELAPGAHT